MVSGIITHPRESLPTRAPPARAEVAILGLERMDAIPSSTGLPVQAATAVNFPSAPAAFSTAGAVGQCSPRAAIVRRRGRPRKGEEMTEEERKARRKEINRLAARRSHRKKQNNLLRLEENNSALKASLARVNGQIRAYESALRSAGHAQTLAPRSEPVSVGPVVRVPSTNNERD